MIKDKIDFDYSLEQIKKELPLNDIKQQDNLLDSKKINKTFTSIENSLNTLYEKCRFLESMMAYAKTFLSVKIDEYTTETKAILDLIEDVRDINKNMSYIEYPVTLTKPVDTIRDRNRGVLYPALLQNDKLILGNQVEKIEVPHSASKKSKSIPYKDNFEDLLKGFYNTTYIEKHLVKSGITERITLNFKNPVAINSIDIGTSNAEVSNITYTYLNGIEEQQEKLMTGFSKDRAVVKISFDLTCRNYNHSIYQIDKSKLTNNTWDTLKEYEYSYINNLSTKLELEEFINVLRGDVVTQINESKAENIISQDTYSYVFGIDYIAIKCVTPYDDACYISKYISVGVLKPEEYITLYSDCSVYNNSTIEFSILDGDMEIPIIPSNHKKVEKERIFNGLNLRFDIDKDKETIIRNNGFAVNISLEEAMNTTTYRDMHSIEYYTLDNKGYSYKPLNKDIRVKAVIRRYNRNGEMPFINTIKIRKYGGSSVWMEAL